MAGAVFMDAQGNPKLPVLTPDGDVPVAVTDTGSSDLGELLRRLIWETQELRRIQCEATDQLFQSYPADAGNGNEHE